MINLPIPFIGCKRGWNKEMTKLFKPYKDVDGLIIIDLFGGSGYCSLLAKHVCSNATVIYNDYDHYTDQFEYMEENMKIMTKIRELVKERNIKKGGKLPDDLVAEILTMLRDLRDEHKLIINLFSSCLCFQFSVLEIDNPKQKLYNKLTEKDYSNNVKQYENLEIVHEDWETLYNKYKGNNKVIFIMDPPYPFTFQTNYKGYSFLANQLRIIDLLNSEPNLLLFTSEKSFIIDCYKWKYNWDSKIKIIRKYMNCLPSRQYKHDEILIYKLLEPSDLSAGLVESVDSVGLVDSVGSP